MQYNPYYMQCPTRAVLDRITDKWVVLMLGLLHEKPWRFNQVRKEIEGISQKVLSQVLKKLERDGLVTRTAFATVPVTVEYAITELGISLDHSLAELIAWGKQNVERMLANQKTFDEGAANRSAPMGVLAIGRVRQL